MAVVAVALVSACAHNPQSLRAIPQDHLAEIQRPEIPLVVNDRVQDWIHYFQGAGRSHFELYLQRSGKYIPMMRKILKSHGLPDNLVYLSMIESGFNPHAYSRARASGAWQFIYQTGLHYGLKVNSWVDERRDPEKSTIAAAKYLKDLYDRFNNWYLAAAGYNAGEGKINRAIRKYATEDFWKLSEKRYLRAETKNYVPKLIAAALIAKNPQDYGFDQIRYEEPISYDEVVLDAPMDLRVAAKLAGVSYEDLKGLNPDVLHWVTPPQSDTFSLRVPSGSAPRFKNHLDSLDRTAWLGEEKLKIDTSTTLARLAREHNVQEDIIVAANKRSLNEVVRPGDTIILPFDPPAGEEFYEKVYEIARHNGSRGGGKVVAYRVRNGDTINRVSRRTGISVASLRKFNPQVSWGHLSKGQRLSLYRTASSGHSRVASSSRNRKSVPARPHHPSAQSVATQSGVSAKGYATHHVKSGDTLVAIAKKYGVSTRDLKTANGISSARRLQAGRNIRVPIPQNLATMSGPSL